MDSVKRPEIEELERMRLENAERLKELEVAYWAAKEKEGYKVHKDIQKSINNTKDEWRLNKSDKY